MHVLGTSAKPTRLAVAALAVGLAFALGACSSGSNGPAADGPLSSGVFGRIPRGANCAPGRLGQPITFADQLFTNHGRTTLTLDRVALLHPHNERLADSAAVPGDLLVGVPGPWPPRYAGIPPTWKLRRPVHGFRLAPGKTFNIALGVAATGSSRARSSGMVIYYHDSSGSYVAANYFAMIIGVKTPC